MTMALNLGVVIAAATTVMAMGDAPQLASRPSSGQRSDLSRKADPLVIDLAGDGFNFTSVSDGIVFPIRIDMTRERIAWTAPGSDDGFLAMDKQRGGIVNSVYNLIAGVRHVNGFAELNSLEREIDGTPISREPDGILDEHDEAFSRLIVWIDANHNGTSDGDELRSLKSAGIISLYMGYERIDQRDQHGNVLRFRGYAIVRNKYDVPVRREVCSVLFAGGGAF
jgi:hypothetical protein